MDEEGDAAEFDREGCVDEYSLPLRYGSGSESKGRATQQQHT